MRLPASALTSTYPPLPFPYLPLPLYHHARTQPPTFTPQFHHRRHFALTLDAHSLRALASAEARVELWHHAPRSQAVAVAMASGRPAAAAGAAGAQSVFLGFAACPLAPLLTRPRGVDGAWLALRSGRGRPVGAVQVSLRLTSIGGRPWGGGDGDTAAAPADAPSALEAYPEWLPALPGDLLPLAALAASPAAYGPGAAGPAPPLPPQLALLDGRLARCSVFVDQVALPAGDDAFSSLEAARGSFYSAAYRLPGSASDRATPAAPPAPLAPETGRFVGALAARGGGGGGGGRAGGGAGGGAGGAGAGAAAWGVQLQFCGVHWVVADADLARAVLRRPLAITVTRQQAVVSAGGGGRGGGGGHGAGAGASVVEVPLGTAEVDLSPLLTARPGKQLSTRWLSGTFALVHPLARDLGGCRVGVKVLLELEPGEAAPEGLALGSPALWDTTADARPAGQLEEGGEEDEMAAATAEEDDEQGCPSDEHQDEPVAAGGPSALPSPQAVAAPSAQASYGWQPRRPPPLPALAAERSSGAASGPGSGAWPSPEPAWRPASARAALLSSPVLAPAPASGRRLHAEVAHAAAPPSSAGGSARTSPLPAAAAALAAATSTTSSLGSVRVCVERALNLELPEVPRGFASACYVRYEWPLCGGGDDGGAGADDVAVCCSPLVLAGPGPLGEACSAQWLSHRLLPLPPGVLDAGGGERMLVLQVWHRALDPDEAAALPPLHLSAEAAPAAGDALVGCAAVDLSALRALGGAPLDGWYRVVDGGRGARGQVKAEVAVVRRGGGGGGVAGGAGGHGGGLPTAADGGDQAGIGSWSAELSSVAAAAGAAAAAAVDGARAVISGDRPPASAAAGAAVAPTSESLMSVLRTNLEVRVQPPCLSAPPRASPQARARRLQWRLFCSREDAGRLIYRDLPLISTIYSL